MYYLPRNRVLQKKSVKFLDYMNQYSPFKISKVTLTYIIWKPGFLYFQENTAEMALLNVWYLCTSQVSSSVSTNLDKMCFGEPVVYIFADS